MKELNYPFDPEWVLKKKKSIKRQLLEDENVSYINKKIAILGGQTTNDIKNILELFLLNYGIRPTFYESEYNMYYEDGMFSNPELEEFTPDLVYICTCIRNITNWPELVNDRKTVDEKLDVNANKFIGLWEHIRDTYHCPIIQNNIEYPFYRLLGNRDASDYRGHVNFVTRLNQRFYDYVDTHEGIYICDVNYFSSSYGRDKWAARYYWHMY